MATTYDALVKDLKGRRFAPTYLLHGDEPYFIDRIAERFEQVLDESERAFNLTVLYGKDIDFKDVVDAARRYPMMAERQVVIIREAQSMKQLANLESYIKQPTDTTLLVLAHKHGKIDGRTKFAKALVEHAVVFESKRLYDNEIPAWVTQYVASKKMTIGQRETVLIAEYLGNDLHKIVNELDKLTINLKEGHTITTDDVQRYIGISKEYNVFELQNALALRDQKKSYQIVQHFCNNLRTNPLVVVIAALSNHFNRIYQMHFLTNANERDMMRALGLSSAYFLKDYRRAQQAFTKVQTERVLHLLRNYDLKSKGVGRAPGCSDENLLKEMVYHILAF